MKLGFVGTGLIGNPMAEKFIDAGYNISVYNRTISKTKNLENKGAVVYKTPIEVIDSSDIIIFMVSDGKVVDEILSSTKNYVGKTIIQMSTIAPQESKTFLKMISGLGGKYCEAPVLGSIQQVREGSLFVMFGGEKDLADTNLELLKVLGEVFYIGEVGKASALKLAFNQLIASLTSAFSLSLGIVLKENISVEQFMGILKRSALFAPTFEKKIKNMISDNYDNPNFPTKHLLKDVNLIIDESESLNLNTGVQKELKAVLQQTINLGLGDKDYSSLFKAIVS